MKLNYNEILETKEYIDHLSLYEVLITMVVVNIIVEIAFNIVDKLINSKGVLK